MEPKQEDKIEVISFMDKEEQKSWTINRTYLTISLSVISVFVIAGGILWLASGGAGSSSAAPPYPTGELEFTDKGVQGQGTYRGLPYPTVKQSAPLVPEKPSKTKTPTSTPAPTASPEATSTPAPTATPAPTTTPVPEATATPTNTPTPTPNDTPTSAPTLTP